MYRSRTATGGVKSSIHSIVGNTWTPLSETLVDIGRYFAGANLLCTNAPGTGRDDGLTFPSGGTDWLDDVALYLKNTDLEAVSPPPTRACWDAQTDLLKPTHPPRKLYTTLGAAASRSIR